MGAMVIVELIDAHDGFYIVTSRIKTTNAIKLLWTIAPLTFFLSALLDNLTTTIVMISLLRKLVADQQLRWWYVGIVVMCANAGGAWSPIGDVTTTMLWIGQHVSASGIMVNLLLPSLIAVIVPVMILSFLFKGKQVVRPKLANAMAQAPSSNYLGDLGKDDDDAVSDATVIAMSGGADSFSSDSGANNNSNTHSTINNSSNAPSIGSLPAQTASSLQGKISDSAAHALAQQAISSRMRLSILVLGLSALAFVPIFKTLTHLPPYMGILFGLGVLWVYTEIMHRHQDWYVKEHMTVVGALSRVDIPSILFFLGILLAVAGLATAGHLTNVAQWLDTTFGNLYVINVFIGLLSSLVDNVPLVAGAMKMYPLLTHSALTGLTGDALIRQSQFLQDGAFWHFLAYCAGTGGSCLIIGSAAGVAAMGMEKVPFMWYLKRISGLALIGYLAGAGTYIAMHVL